MTYGSIEPSTVVALAGHFDSLALVGQLRDKIRLDLVTLMPPEAWEAMLRKEIEAFTLPRKFEQVRDQWGKVTSTTEAVSQLGLIVRELLSAEAKKRILAMLATDDWGGATYDDLVAPKVKQLIAENMGAIMTSMLEGMVQQTVRNMRNV